MLRLRQERALGRLLNEPQVAPDGSAAAPTAAAAEGKLQRGQLEAELRLREERLQSGACDGGITDQWRVYCFAIHALQHGPPLRLLVQASAGTGKSYLLTTIYLWALLRGLRVRCAAPTGIAAANIEITGSDVKATTLHSLYDLDGELTSRLDFAKISHPKVQEVMLIQVLLIDEFSMLDVDAWCAVETCMSQVDHTRRPHAREADAFGEVHVILFGDYKQLPPATSQAPFIVLPSVHAAFEVRVLRQNRRVVVDAARTCELEAFHDVLTSIAEAKATAAVRAFVLGAYVRGASQNSAEHVDVESTTSVFTKRRYRDAWNRVVVRRIARVHNHSLKVKARARARGAQGQQFLTEARTKMLRKKARTQALWNLHLAGDWHQDHETKALPPRPHLMRVMLVSNIAVDQRRALRGGHLVGIACRVVRQRVETELGCL